MDRTVTARMEEGIKIVSFKVITDGNTCLPNYALLVERSKTSANAFKVLSSASRIKGLRVGPSLGLTEEKNRGREVLI